MSASRVLPLMTPQLHQSIPDLIIDADRQFNQHLLKLNQVHNCNYFVQTTSLEVNGNNIISGGTECMPEVSAISSKLDDTNVVDVSDEETEQQRRLLLHGNNKMQFDLKRLLFNRKKYKQHNTNVKTHSHQQDKNPGFNAKIDFNKNVEFADLSTLTQNGTGKYQNASLSSERVKQRHDKIDSTKCSVDHQLNTDSNHIDHTQNFVRLVKCK